MGVDVPAYYSSLARFRELFEKGLPILTYHKLGPRPRSARIKGLYLSASLFERQIIELKAAGFSTCSVGDFARPRERSVALTFDDGYRNTLTYGLGPLVDRGFSAIQFLVADLIAKSNEWDLPGGEVREPLMDASEIREWLAAGNEIGSHTLTHPFLTRLPPAAAREEIMASKKKLEDLFGRRVDHFCYPYGDWNPSIRDLVTEAGYATACTTVSGVNSPGESPFLLKRIPARYPSTNLKALWSRFRFRMTRARG